MRLVLLDLLIPHTPSLFSSNEPGLICLSMLCMENGNGNQCFHFGRGKQSESEKLILWDFLSSSNLYH
jgi:hypothetical protein